MESGGRADKFGNEFEKLWVVDQAMRRVLHGDARALLWEPLGQEGEGIDLQLFLDDGLEVHQCKIGNRSEGTWPIGELARRRVLRSAKVQLEDHQASKFVFVSRDTTALADLAERAQRCDSDPRVFLTDSLANEKLRRDFKSLCKHWNLEPAEDNDVGCALSLLRRCRHASGIATEDDKARLDSFAELFAEGEGRKIIDALGRYLTARLGNRVHADELREFLRKEGYPPRDLAGDPRIPEAIEAHQQRFRALVEPDLIAKEILPRDETGKLLELILDDRGPRILILHGDKGSGKTGILLELTQALDRSNIPFLPLRLDSQQSPRGSLESYSRKFLDLPAPPQICLHHLADERPSVLLVDQLDAIRWTGSHSGESWYLCRQMIEGALQLPGMRVVLASRTFDLEDHPQIRNWEGSQHLDQPKLMERVEVTSLAEGTVKAVVEGCGGDYASMSERQRNLLSNAHGLQLWWRLVERGALPSEFATKTDLIQAYWEECYQRAEADAKISRERLKCAIAGLVEHLDREQTIVAPELLLSDFRDAQRFLCSQGVLHSPSKGLLRFNHQSHLDYLIAKRVAKEALADHQRVLEWVLSHDQSLFRREQLRQLLTLLRDSAPAQYISALTELLQEEGIRFHLRHLALGLLRAVPDPKPEEIDLVLELLEDDRWRPHVLSQVLARSGAWFEALARQGLWENWMASNHEERVEAALQQCRSKVEMHGSTVESLLSPYWSEGSTSWRARIAGILSYDPTKDTSRLFEWRLDLIRSGQVRGLGPWHGLDLLVKKPRRVIELLGAWLSKYVAESSSGHSANDFQDFAIEHESCAKIASAGTSEPDLAWEVLVPFLPDLWSNFLREHPYYESSSYVDYFPRSGADSMVLWLACLTLRRAGETLAAEAAGNVFLDRIGKLLTPARTLLPLRWIVLNSLSAGRDELANDAVAILLSATVNFESKMFGKLDEVDPAEALIRRFAASCSDVPYQELERYLLGYYPEREKRDHRHASELNIESFSSGTKALRSNVFGRAQMCYLEVLPDDRISDRADARLQVWRSKFGEIENRSFEMVSGWVRSPIPRKRLHLVPDSDWRRIVTCAWATEGRRRRQDGENVIKSSHGTFSSDFQRAAHMMPSRFSKLMVKMAESPATALSAYYDTLLAALAETKPPEGLPDELCPWEPAAVEEVELVFGCVDRQNEPAAARRFCQLIKNRAEAKWSPQVLGRVAELAGHPDPDDSYKFAPLNEDQSELFMYFGGPSSTVRGVAAEAICALLFKDEDLLAGFLPTIRRLVADPHVAVRVAAREVCLAILNIDRDLAVDLYLQACDHIDDQALIPDSFLQYAWWTHSKKIEPVVRRMLASSFPILVKHAASLAVVGWMIKGFFPGLAEECLRGDKTKRVGAIRALSAIFRKEPEQRDKCWEVIIDYGLGDEDVDRSWLAELLREAEILGGNWGPRISLRLLDSPDFEKRCFWLIKGLKDYGGSLAPYAGPLRKLIQRLADCQPEQIHALHWRLDDVPALLLRLYDEADSRRNKELRELCLNAWDRMLESGIGNALRQVEIIDSSA